MKLEKGYTVKQLNEFMITANREGLKSRRTRDGGWETYTPIDNEKQPPRATSQGPARPLTKQATTSAGKAGSLHTSASVEKSASVENNPEVEKPAGKGMWKRFKSLFSGK